MFKRNFEKLCSHKGVSPSYVCKEIGLSNATYSCWTDESIPRNTTLLKLAEYFGVSVEYLKGETDEIDTKENNSPYGELSQAQKDLIDLIPAMTEKQVAKVQQIISLLEPEE